MGKPAEKLSSFGLSTGALSCKEVGELQVPFLKEGPRHSSHAGAWCKRRTRHNTEESCSALEDQTLWIANSSALWLTYHV